MLKTVNRVLLGLLGLGLVRPGRRRAAGRTGSAAPLEFRRAGLVALPRAGRRGAGRLGTHPVEQEDWWWPTVIAVLAVLLALLLWWLFAQRRHRLDRVLVDSGDGGPARLDGRTLERAIEEEAQALEGVSRAHVRLTGRRTAPTARVRLLLEPHADPARALGRLSRETLAHARDSAGLDRLPSKVRLREARHRAKRTA